MATPFDAQAILDAVDAGIAPDDWKVYRARKGYFLGHGCMLWLVSLLFPAITIALVVLVNGLSLSGDAPLLYFDLFLGLTWAALAIICSWQGSTLLRQLGSASEQMVVLTPDGLVVRTGPNQWLPAYSDVGISSGLPWAGVRGGRIYSAAYAEMVSADLSVWNTLFQARASLIMTFVHPRRLIFWRVPPRFAYSDTITQSIIEARTRYEALHAEAQLSRQPNGQD